MKYPGKLFWLFLPFLIFYNAFSYGQVQVIDRVMAVVGSKIVLQSDVEKQYLQLLAQGEDDHGTLKCEILDELMMQKLLLNQSELDSVTVTEAQVEGELDRRMRYYIRQIGSEQLLEEYFKTSITKLKAELRDMIREQLIVQTMQSKITKDVSITPSEVRAYFKSIPEDSIPYIDSELEVAQIVKKPAVSDLEKKAVKEKMEEYRQAIINGADFTVYAALYSADKESARKGGELGLFERGTMVPEFEAAAFNLKPGEVSKVVETKFGYHLLQLIERRGEQINVRHILLQPYVSEADKQRAIAMLDSIRSRIVGGFISFDEAAEKLSDDDETRRNGGLILNPETGTSKLSPDKMDRMLFFQVDTLSLNTVSKALPMTTSENKTAYRLVIKKSHSQPHQANLKDDYQRIQEAALSEKQGKTLNDWIEKKRKSTYIDINTGEEECGILKHWMANYN